MRRFEIYDNTDRLTGEGVEWTGGGFDLLLNALDDPDGGGAWHSGESMAQALRWLDEMAQFRRPGAALEVRWVDAEHHREAPP